MSRSPHQIIAQQALAGALNPPPGDDIEKARMRAALLEIQRVVSEAPTKEGHIASVMCRIDQIARKRLAP